MPWQGDTEEVVSSNPVASQGFFYREKSAVVCVLNQLVVDFVHYESSSCAIDYLSVVKRIPNSKVRQQKNGLWIHFLIFCFLTTPSHRCISMCGSMN